MTEEGRKQAGLRVREIRSKLGRMTLEPTSENIRLLSDAMENLADVLTELLADSDHARAVAALRVPGIEEPGRALSSEADPRG